MVRKSLYEQFSAKVTKEMVPKIRYTLYVKRLQGEREYSTAKRTIRMKHETATSDRI